MGNVSMTTAKHILLELLTVKNAIEAMISMIKMFVLKYNVIVLKDIFIILMINVIMLEKSLKLIVLQALLNFQDVPKSLLIAV